VRNASNPAPVQSFRQGKNKRRYDVAIGVPGAEMRLPTLPSLRLGWHFLSGLLAVGLLGLLYYVWTCPTFRVQTVEIVGLKRLSQADVNTVIGLVGEPVFTIAPDIIQADLQAAFPELSAITVEVNAPASVVVSVNERVPVLAWKKEGQELWVDADGVSFPPRGDLAPDQTIEGDLPILEQAEVKDGKQAPLPRLDPQMVSAILKVGAQMPKKARLVYNSEHGLSWKDKRGWQVYFGITGMDPNTMEMRLKIYAALVQKLTKNDIKPILISVEYIHAPFYRVEQ
jgi:cell division protein FtsQ